MTNFSDRLRSLQKDMNASEFARFLGVKQQTLDHYLRNKRKPNIGFVLNVCTKCCRSSDWLLGLEDTHYSISGLPGLPEKFTLTDVVAPCPECAKKDSVIKTLADSNRLLVERLGKVHYQPEIKRGGKKDKAS